MANSTHHSGYLARDPELRATQSGLSVCDLRLAVQRRRGRDGEDRGAFFIDVTTFGRQADACAQYLAKGRRVLVDGQLDVQEWTGQDGIKRWTPKIIADQVEFLDRADRDTGDQPEPPAPAQPPADEVAAKRQTRRRTAKAA